MENHMDVMSALGGAGGAAGRSMRLRVSSVIVALALVAATLLIVQQRAEAAPGSAPAAAAVAVPGLDGASAQITINIAAIVCPILIAVRNAFAETAFFSFVQAILNQLLVFFGCSPSG